MLAVQRDTVSKVFSEAISHLFSDPYCTKSVSICIDHFQLREFFPHRKGDIPILKEKFHNGGLSNADNWNLLSIKPID